MQNNPDYAKMFRGRPIRFVLPLNPEPQAAAGDANLINLEDTKATANYLVNGDILVRAEKLCDLGCETPRIHYERYLGKTVQRVKCIRKNVLFLGKKYRYFYAISSDVDAENPGTIIKVDVKMKATQTWQEDKCFPGEPIFVPTPESKVT